MRWNKRLRGGARAPWIVGAVAMVAMLILSTAVPAGAQIDPSSDATTDPVDADFHTLRTPALAEDQFEIITLSTLPDTVTDGDVLVAIRGVDDTAALMVSVDGRDVTDSFSIVEGARERRGLITDLAIGPAVITATAGDQVARLQIRNHPVSGPVLSGPHQTPFACRTADAGLGEPLDANCMVAPTVNWHYRSSDDQAFHPLTDPYGAYPDDVSMTQTEDGRAVPFIARVESRIINRGIARIAVLDDPAARGADAPFEAAQWDKRVYYAFGESCGVGYQQGTNSEETVLGNLDLTEVDGDNLLINLVGITARLGAGDVIVHSTLTSYGVHCNPLVSIETTMMIKEYLNEHYGLVEAVVGTNGSGAALQQYNAANNAPGLISAAMPTATFADIATTAMTVTDCGLLNNYYDGPGAGLSQEQRAAINGHTLTTTTDFNDICRSWEDTFLDRVKPGRGCSVPSETRYDPDTNPTGVRCTIQDANVNIFGTDPATGFANRPLDNGGVEYGLRALQSGAISMAEFIDLNEKIGGYDIDGEPMAARHEMASEFASLLYRIGGVIGRGALDETPVLDLAPYLDLIPIANIHESLRPFVIRERLRAQTGQDRTQVIWRGVLTQADAYDDMEEWLDNVLAGRPDHGGDHVAAVQDARPSAMYDRCVFGTVGGRLDFPSAVYGPLGIQQPLLPGVLGDPVGVPVRVDVPEDFDSGIGACAVALPVVDDPRIAAGGPRSDDVVKCQRKPVDAADHPGATAADLDQLRAIFPDGVCDFTKPAAEDVSDSMLWVSVGGDTVEAPHELSWRVGRSVVASSAGDALVLSGPVAARPPGASGAGSLPATGSPVALLFGPMLLVIGLAVRARRSVPAAR